MSIVIAPVTVYGSNLYTSGLAFLQARAPARPPVRVRVKPKPKPAPMRRGVSRDEEQERRTNEYFAKQAARQGDAIGLPRDAFESIYGIKMPAIDMAPALSRNASLQPIAGTKAQLATITMEALTVTAPKVRTTPGATFQQLQRGMEPVPQTSPRPQLAKPKMKVGRIDLETLTRTGTPGVDFQPNIDGALRRKSPGAKAETDTCVKEKKRDRNKCPTRGYRLICKSWSKQKCL